MAQKPSIPKGTRDFSPAEMTNRNYIFDSIKSIFRLYGFQPIETPAMENLSTLMGKYGEEGDKLLFKILNSGDFAAAPSDQDLLERNSIRLTNKISEKGLRYDLTVPFARFVVQYRNDISFPLPDSARLACRPTSKRPLPRVLPMRCRYCGQRFVAQRNGIGADCRSGFL